MNIGSNLTLDMLELIARRYEDEEDKQVCAWMQLSEVEKYQVTLKKRRVLKC